MRNEFTGRIAFLADIHGNFIYLERIANFIERYYSPDLWFSLGDAVGYFPDGKNVIDFLRANNFCCIAGNHEEMLLKSGPLYNDDIYCINKQRDILDSMQLNWIKTWPIRYTICTMNNQILCVHGSPDDPLHGYLYHDSDFNLLIPNEEYSCLVTGHTHRPLHTHFKHILLLNPGSVGLPRDGSKAASAAILDTDGMKVRHIQIQIDIFELHNKYGASVHTSVYKRLEA